MSKRSTNELEELVKKPSAGKVTKELGKEYIKRTGLGVKNSIVKMAHYAGAIPVGFLSPEKQERYAEKYLGDKSKSRRITIMSSVTEGVSGIASMVGGTVLLPIEPISGTCLLVSGYTTYIDGVLRIGKRKTKGSYLVSAPSKLCKIASGLWKGARKSITGEYERKRNELREKN